MNLPTVTKEEYLLFKNFIEKECAISIKEEKQYIIQHRLSNLVSQTGSESFKELHRKVMMDQTGVLKNKIINAITTNETLWFRDEYPFMVFDEVFMPKVIERMKSRGRHKIRIWSAACSTGQEPYSLAIKIDQLCKKDKSITKDNFHILATDISSNALFAAISGRYGNVQINRGLDEKTRATYFKDDGHAWEIDNEIKKMVTFKQFNLKNSLRELGVFDIVFCRNVMIYFSEEFKRDLLNRISHIQSQDSFLITGAAESIRGLCDNYNPVYYNKAIYYSRI